MASSASAALSRAMNALPVRKRARLAQGVFGYCPHLLRQAKGRLWVALLYESIASRNPSGARNGWWRDGSDCLHRSRHLVPGATRSGSENGEYDHSHNYENGPVMILLHHDCMIRPHNSL